MYIDNKEPSNADVIIGALVAGATLLFVVWLGIGA